jgi:hypothetical protein
MYQIAQTLAAIPGGCNRKEETLPYRKIRNKGAIGKRRETFFQSRPGCSNILDIISNITDKQRITTTNSKL